MIVSIVAVLLLGLLTEISGDCSGNGISLGKLQGQNGLQGDVFAVNRTIVQILGFSINVPTGAYFWADQPSSGGKLTDVFIWDESADVLKPLYTDVTAGELTKLSNVHIVIRFKDDIKSHSSLSVSDGQKLYGSVQIPAGIQLPEEQELSVGVHGKLYGVNSGKIRILNARTIILPAFRFQGDKPPDGWVFGGVLTANGDVVAENGEKARIIGRDTKANHEALHERWDGSKTVMAVFDERNVCEMEFIGVYCYAVGVDFGHTDIRGLIQKDKVAPYIPPISLVAADVI